jgi:hypothetical protein
MWLEAVIIATVGAGFGWSFACWCRVGVFLVAPASAWIMELRSERQLVRWFEEGPAGVMQVFGRLPHKKVVKSS